MNLSDIKTSKYLKKDDVGTGALLTITGITSENVAKEGAEPEYKAVMHFAENEKGMVLNATNGQLIGQLTGITENIDKEWVGFQIVLYNDPAITFGGKLTGGIRVRAPKQGMKRLQASEMTTMPKHETADNLPF